MVFPLLALVERLETKGVALRMLDFGGSTLDTKGPTGKLLLTLAGAIPEFERAGGRNANHFRSSGMFGLGNGGLGCQLGRAPPPFRGGACDKVSVVLHQCRVGDFSSLLPVRVSNHPKLFCVSSFPCCEGPSKRVGMQQWQLIPPLLLQRVPQWDSV
jgi:hypothetical protein